MNWRRTGLTLDYVRFGIFTRFSRIFRSWFFIATLGRILGVPVSPKPAALCWREKLQPNILIVRSDGLGDLVLTLPFFHGLRRHFPGAHITLICAPPWPPIAQQMSALDEVLVNPNSRSRWEAINNVARSAWFGFCTLRHKRFDVAFCPRWESDLADDYLLAFFSFAPHRVSFSEISTAWRRGAERGRDRFFTQIVTDSGVKHEAERSLTLLGALGVKPPTDPHQEDTAYFKTQPKPPLQFASETVPIGVFPAVEFEEKQWPIKYFIETARQIASQRPVTFLVFGTKSQSALCQRFCEELGSAAINFCDRITIDELPAYLAVCRAVLSCDSGGAHLAGILNLPVLVLFRTSLETDPNHLGSPTRFRPLGANVTVLQPTRPPSFPEPPHGRAIEGICPAEVAAKMIELLDGATRVAG